MSKCNKCNSQMKQLFTSEYCANCENPKSDSQTVVNFDELDTLDHISYNADTNGIGIQSGVPKPSAQDYSRKISIYKYDLDDTINNHILFQEKRLPDKIQALEKITYNKEKEEYIFNLESKLLRRGSAMINFTLYEAQNGITFRAVLERALLNESVYN